MEKFQYNISVHRPKHKYPQNDHDWGSYLSGLIDGGGYLSPKHKQPKISICFHEKDVSLAYRIKQFIGYGTVSKIKGKRAFNFVLTSRLGLIKICRILTQLQTQQKRQRWIDLCCYYGISVQNMEEDNLSLLTCYWLSGFIDADGHFSLYIRYRKDRPKPTVHLFLKIDQSIKNNEILIELKNQIGGTLYYNEKRKSVSYSSSSLQNAQRLIHYLDRFHVNSNKYKEYVIWRRSFFYRTDIKRIQLFQKRLKILRQVPKI